MIIISILMGNHGQNLQIVKRLITTLHHLPLAYVGNMTPILHQNLVAWQTFLMELIPCYTDSQIDKAWTWIIDGQVISITLGLLMAGSAYQGWIHEYIDDRSSYRVFEHACKGSPSACHLPRHKKASKHARSPPLRLQLMN
jgi:hypothetical protein